MYRTNKLLKGRMKTTHILIYLKELSFCHSPNTIEAANNIVFDKKRKKSVRDIGNDVNFPQHRVRPYVIGEVPKGNQYVNPLLAFDRCDQTK